MNKIISTLVSLGVVSLLTLPVLANDTDLRVSGGIGAGSLLTGQGNGSSTDNVGAGFGYGIKANAAGAWKILGFDLGVLYGRHGDTEVTVNGVKSEFAGSGNFFTFDITGGLNFARSDFGYHYLYGGLRIWNDTYNITKTTIAGVDTSTTSDKSFGGSGWIAGYRYTGSFLKEALSGNSLILMLGFFVDSAPAKEITTNGTTNTVTDPTGLGFGYEGALGIGLPSNLYFLLGYRTDIIITLANNNIGAAGAGLYTLSAGMKF